jgi:arsenate reductase (thioredoxin)
LHEPCRNLECLGQAALLTGYARGRVHASSAGASPAAALDHTLVRVAGELDIDLSEAFPKTVTSEAVQVADLVIILGKATLDTDSAGLADHQVRHWDVPALINRPDDAIREALNELDRHALRLLADLLATQPARSGADADGR